jgi:battenin
VASAPRKEEEVEQSKNVALDFQTLRIVFPKCYHLIINLFAVYFFEYSIIGCFADRMGNKMLIKYPERKDDFAVKQYFVILNNCYQVGVFMSRSSLQLIKIRRVWLLSLFQMINFAFLFANTQYMFVDTLYLLCPLLVWVGFMGGASYVNVMHNILELKTLKNSEREAALALSLMFNDTGVLSAAIFSLVIDNTLFKS